MVVIYLLCFILICIGIVLLLGLTPEIVTNDLMKLISPKQTLRDKAQIAKGRKKSRRLTKEILHIRDALEATGKSKQFTLSCAASVVLLVVGCILAVVIDNYFLTYPGVKTYIERSVAEAREKGYIETLFGRRRYLPDITSRNAVVRGYAERNAVNAPIQGTAADIIKVAMIRIDRRLREEGLRSKMILQVHDELNFSVPHEELPHLQRIVIEEMENACPLSVPLLADCGTGSNWLEAH